MIQPVYQIKKPLEDLIELVTPSSGTRQHYLRHSEIKVDTIELKWRMKQQPTKRWINEFKNEHTVDKTENNTVVIEALKSNAWESRNSTR